MPSKVLRRSGISVIAIAEWLEWKPTAIVQVGLGHHHEEAHAMKEAWPDCRFVAFEPHPAANRTPEDQTVLTASKRRNRSKVAVPYPGEVCNKAVGDREGEVVLWDKFRHMDGSSIHPRDDPRDYPVTVPMTTLDTALPDPRNLGEHVMLWLDCEGSELSALKGGEKFLRSVEVVNVEMTGNPPREGWCDAGEVHDWLNDHGFFRVWIHTQRSCIGQYDCVYAAADVFRPEQCCCPCQIAKWRERCERNRRAPTED